MPERPRRRRPAARPRRSPPITGTPGYIAVGQIGGPRGLRGELKVQPLTDFPERFQPGASLWVRSHRHEVRGARWTARVVYLTLSEVDNRSAAETLRGALLEVPEDDLMPLPEGHYYRFQIIGLQVCTPEGSTLGRVAEIIATGSNDVYVVRGGRRELLIPAIEDVVKAVDLQSGRLVVEPPTEV